MLWTLRTNRVITYICSLLIISPSLALSPISILYWNWIDEMEIVINKLLIIANVWLGQFGCWKPVLNRFRCGRPCHLKTINSSITSHFVINHLCRLHHGVYVCVCLCKPTTVLCTNNFALSLSLFQSLAPQYSYSLLRNFSTTAHRYK